MNKPLKIFIHTGEIKSKKDGDIHRLGVSELKKLYGVRDTDIVVVYSSTNPTHRSDAVDRHYPDYIHIGPRSDGKYMNIHEWAKLFKG